MTIQLAPWTHPTSGQTRLYVNGAGPDKLYFVEHRGRPALLQTSGRDAGKDRLVSVLDALMAQGALTEGEPVTWEALVLAAASGRDAPPAGRAPRAGSGRVAPFSPPPGSSERSRQATELDPLSIDFPGPVKIRLDHREPAELAALLEQHPAVDLEVCTLELGDIEIPGPDGVRVLIERKDCSPRESRTDFEASIIHDDKRLFRQSEGMKMDPGVIGVLMLEGDVYANSRSMLVQQVDGALSFLSVIQGMSIMPTYNLNHSAYMVIKIARHYRYGLGYELGLRNKAKMPLLDAKAYVLEGIPGVNAALARALLQHFGSVKAVAAASRTELLKVEGIGPKRAEQILEALN